MVIPVLAITAASLDVRSDAAVADAAICPILTLDAARWRQYAERLDEPLHIIEIADPDEAPEDRAGD